MSREVRSASPLSRRAVVAGLISGGLAMAVLATAVLATAAIGVSGPARAAPQKPADFVLELYKAAMGPKGDFSNGVAVFGDEKGRQRFLSRKLRTALEAMDKRTPAGDAPDLDFDPVSAGNDPDVHDLAVTTDSIDGSNAAVIVKFRSHDQPVVLHYLLVQEGGAWKVDDIIAEEGDGWQVSKIIEGE
jgi:hypothetical protein